MHLVKLESEIRVSQKDETLIQDAICIPTNVYDSNEHSTLITSAKHGLIELTRFHKNHLDYEKDKWVNCLQIAYTRQIMGYPMIWGKY